MNLDEQIEVIKGLEESLSLTNILQRKITEDDIVKLVALFEIIEDIKIPQLINMEEIGQS